MRSVSGINRTSKRSNGPKSNEHQREHSVVSTSRAPLYYETRNQYNSQPYQTFRPYVKHPTKVQYPAPILPATAHRPKCSRSNAQDATCWNTPVPVCGNRMSWTHYPRAGALSQTLPRNSIEEREIGMGSPQSNNVSDCKKRHSPCAVCDGCSVKFPTYA
ncbi:hypothetical protein P168DRAFT_79338 [Aspergillus campestris IBT 28561]|uniref:Uncharacterized protein n=1 Tax=Aspergillus campestris (strain IBT 28561) TaxID=1392248 RepID=A0A2I1CR35_ASPC2|nr:uncharacterized protein P168DRAFT_79338 [Aspergillus campestris IBT 28561]PKY00074.1 hypothetical protein P168DRAFT_79338 [Aspergillus campestris IBT 28561]